MLLVSDKLQQKQVYDITTALFKEKETLNEAVPVQLDLIEKNAVESITIPFHPGAAQYYKECGIAIEAYGEKGEQK